MDQVTREQPDEVEVIPIPAALPESLGQLPLVVGLEGTLVATNTSLESALSLIRRSPSTLISLLVWLLGGKAVLKAEIARRIRPAVETLPYRNDLLRYLERERAYGRRLVLATASHESTANSVAAHLGIFDEVLASNEAVDLSGTRKRDALIERFGARGFDYVGSSREDISVWEACRTGYVAGPMSALPRSVTSAGVMRGEVFPGKRARLGPWVREMRVYQWAKNLLVIAPAILNHYVDWNILKAQAIAFLGLSFIASGTYIANDLFDLDADRRHPWKCKRPLASGEISVTQGICAAVLLVPAGILMGALIGRRMIACMLAYLLLSSLYSSFLKGKPIIDVIVLAMLYTLRIYVGGLAIGVYVSPWLSQFSIFCFLSLAFVKRYSELLRVQERGRLEVSGRSYRPPDLSVISQAGICSGLLAGLVLALYVNGLEIEKLYPRPEMLWGIFPLFIYWITRVWLIAHRGNMHEDPVVFAFRDRVSYMVGALILVAFLLALIPNAG